MIIETKLQGFNSQLKYDKLNYPQCGCGKCFKFYWNMLNIGSRGSGKTYTVCQIIKHYENNKITKDGVEYKVRTHLISPTIQANEIYQSLNSLDMKDLLNLFNGTNMKENEKNFNKYSQDLEKIIN